MKSDLIGMKAIVIFTLFAFNIPLWAQSDSLIRKSTAYLSLLKTANDKFETGDYYDAIPDFENLIKQDPDNAQLQLKYGICMAESGKDKLKALPFLKYASRAGINMSNYYLGKVYYISLKFDSANYYLLKFKSGADKSEIKKSDVNKLVNNMYDALMLLNTPSKIRISNLGREINSTYADYCPVIAADNSLLVFTSRRSDTRGGKADNNRQFFEDIYFSINRDGQWQEAENIGTPLNSKEHDASVAISADGSMLILYRTDPYSGKGDLFFSKKEGYQWSLPIQLGLNINSEYEETSASLTPDQQTIYFTSNRPGGYGGLDIYRSTRRKNGVWGKAENLGSKVNTKYDEEAPFICADGKTLYFSSKGQEINMGGYDVYKSILEVKNGFGTPLNMGSPINTLEDDLYFVLTANGQTGYISSSRSDSEGDLDIYELQMNGDQFPVTLFKGTVLNDRSGRPVKAIITVIERETGKVLFSSASNQATGDFLIVLCNDKELKVIFERGDDSFTEIIDPIPESKFREIYKDVRLEER